MYQHHRRLNQIKPKYIKIKLYHFDLFKQLFTLFYLILFFCIDLFIFNDNFVKAY